MPGGKKKTAAPLIIETPATGKTSIASWLRKNKPAGQASPAERLRFMQQEAESFRTFCMTSSETNIRMAIDALRKGAFTAAMPPNYQPTVNVLREKGEKALRALADNLARSKPADQHAMREASAAVFQQITKDINALLRAQPLAAPASSAGLRRNGGLPLRVREHIAKMRGVVAMYRRRCRKLTPAQLRYYAQDIDSSALNANVPLPYRAITSKWREEAREIFTSLARQLDDVRKAMRKEGFDMYKTEKDAENAMYRDAVEAFTLILNEIDKVLAQP